MNDRNLSTICGLPKLVVFGVFLLVVAIRSYAGINFS